MYAIKLTTNGEIKKIEVPKNANHTWYAEQIGCEWIELVRPRKYDYTLIIDEEGLLDEKPINPIASIMYGFFEHGCPIVGDALMMREDIVDGEMDLVSLSEEDIEIAMECLKNLKIRMKGTK